jgi:hypothetical protein
LVEEETSTLRSVRLWRRLGDLIAPHSTTQTAQQEAEEHMKFKTLVKKRKILV